ncbi:MAG: polynucleotide adenylyltransferase, partial [Deltaproteobacteria bacterium]|nr:polynucleotide adenylyltransferase [Deltaproteobacteria bacterium]
MSEQISNPKINPPPEVLALGDAIKRAGGRPVLVGGWVRDALLGAGQGKDFDLEVFGLSLEQVRKVLKPFGVLHSVGRHFGVLKLITPWGEYDVSIPRRESNIGKGHKGFWVRADPDMSFEEAASRRDFTINSLGYDLVENRLLDPFQGEEHLKQGVLRHVGPAFGEDPLRVLRAMQFAGRFGLEIAADTLIICRQQDLNELPRERLWEEFRKLLLQSAQPSRGLIYAPELGLLPYFPELRVLHEAPPPAEGPSVWTHTLATVDQAASLRTGEPGHDLTLMYAALCHGMEGVGSPGSGAESATAFLSRLTNSTELLKAVPALLKELPQPQRLFAQRTTARSGVAGVPAESGASRAPGATDGEVRRLALRVPIPLLLEVDTARYRALEALRAHAATPTVYPAGEWLRAEALRLGVWEGPPKPLLMGRHLAEQGMNPGREMGVLLHSAFEAQLDGRITS